MFQINEKPLFLGHDYKSQLISIINILGKPLEEDIKADKNAKKFLLNLENKTGIGIENILKGVDKEAIDLLKVILLLI
jgi:hypothetical protein